MSSSRDSAEMPPRVGFVDRVRQVLARPLVKNAFWRIADKVLRMLLSLLVGVWVARYLGPGRFGLLNFAIAFVGLFTFLADVGLQSVLVRDLVRGPGERVSLLASALALRLSGAALAIVATTASVHAFRPGSSLSQAAVLVIALGLIPQAWDIVDYDFQARMHSRPIVLIRALSLVVFSFAKIALIVVRAPLLAFAWAQIGEIALAALLMRVLFMKELPCFALSKATQAQMSRLLSECWPVAIASLSIVVYMRIDQVMLGQLAGDHAVGVFSAAVRVSESWYFIPMSMLAAVAPALTAAYHRSEEEYRRKQLLFARAMVYLSVTVAALLAAGADRVTNLLYGSGYQGAGQVLAIHAWAGVFAALGVATGPWFVNTGILKLSMIYTLLGAVANIGMNAFMIPHYGAIGAAVSTLVSYSLAAFWLNLCSRRTRPLFLIQARSWLPI